jgi:uncharacterized protein
MLRLMRLLATIWCCLVGLAAHAQSASPTPVATPPTPESVAAAIDAATPRGPLYTFEKNGKTHTLMGTLHVGRQAWFPMDWGVIAPLVAAQTLVMEANLADTQDAQRAFAQYAVEPSSQPNWAALPAKMRAQLVKLSSELGLPEVELRKQKPWMATLTLTLLANQRDGLLTEAGTEMFLTGVVAPRGTPIVALEGFAKQLALFDNMPADVKQEFIAQAVNDLSSSKGKEATAELVRAWESGQLGLLEAALRAEYDHNNKADKFFLEELILKRNVSMAEGIDQLAKDKTLFVAVGALHLAGKQGLVELLRGKGYTVKQAPRGLEAKPRAGK